LNLPALPSISSAEPRVWTNWGEVSFKMRSMLALVKGFNQTLLEDKNEALYSHEQRREFYSIIDQNMNDLNHLIDELTTEWWLNEQAHKAQANAIPRIAEPKEGESSQETMNSVSVRIQRETDALDLPLPAYATAGAAGMDLHAAIPDDEAITLKPGERRLISTGIRIALPRGYEAQVRPRSGLAVKHGIGLVNAPGTIDEDYRGVVYVCLINHGDSPFTIRRGDRIAQMVIAPVTQAEWHEVEALDETNRGAGGFGSTGVEAKENGKNS